MKIIETSIAEVVIIEPHLFKDKRGYFFESITTVNQTLLEDGELMVRILEHGLVWLGTGTHGLLSEASNDIGVIMCTMFIKCN